MVDMKHIKRFWAYIRYIVLSEDLPFDVRTANMVCLVGVVSLVLATAVRMCIGASLQVVSVMLSLVFLAIFFLYLTYRYNLYGILLWVMIIAIGDVLLPLTIFIAGGADSGIAAFCVMGTTAILLLTRGKQRVALAAVNVLILIGCFLFAAYNPQWVEQFDSSQPVLQTADNIFAYLVSTLFIGSCLLFQRYMYTQEKEKVERAVTALEKERQATFAFFEASPHMNLLFNDKLEMIDCNPAALQIADGALAKEELIGRLPQIVSEATPMLQPDGRPSASLKIWLEKTMREGETHFETALQVRGSVYNLSVIMKRVPYEESFAIAVFLVDQTELYAARREALDNAKAKSVFLANMSHEIRTPLNAVISMTSIGKNATDLSRKDYAFGHIGDAADHLLGVINDVLDMSKIEADKFELNKTAFSLAAMLHRVENVMSFKAGEKDQQLTFHVDADVPKGIISDEQRLAQVITNLLSNAVKFTPEGGTIAVSVNLAEKHLGSVLLRFAVRDTGIGLSEDQAARVFRSFEQAESDTTRKFGGTGLGLAISKSFVEKMGGAISVTSELGKGSTFEFTIEAKPAKLEDPVEGAPQKDLSEDEDFTGFNLLLAEDVELNKEIVFALLEPLGFTIDWAKDGYEALELFEANPNRYHLILMDMQMPEMDGLEATHRIRTSKTYRGKSIPIIALTANVFKEDVDRSLAAGMNDHLGKPIDFEALTAMLHRYLREEKRG
jgi:signal transduction histidine kinase/ActR/RegA family two-component response regulator